MALTGEVYNKNSEGMVRTIKQLMIKTLLRTGHTVLVDGTHTTIKSIEKIFSYDIDAQPIIIDTDEETCKSRAVDSGQIDLIPVIERMNSNLSNLIYGARDLKDAIEDIRDEMR